MSDERLDSWKKIASYLKRDVSTVQRWERREAMPVHRHQHEKLGSVFAFKSELDAWWKSRRTVLTDEVGAEAAAGAAEDAPPAAPGPQTAEEASRLADGRSKLRRPALWLTTGGLVAFALALAWLFAGNGYSWRSPLANARFAPLLEFSGNQNEVAISHDGAWVAFLANRDGKVDAWLSAVGSGTYRNLTQGNAPELVNPSIRTLGFSADSSLISIWTRRSDGSQLGDVNIMSTPAAGGPLQLFLRGAAELDWSHDGRQLIYHTTAPGDPLFLRQVGSQGNISDRRIYTAANGVHCHFPVWSVDDDCIYFLRGVPPDDWDTWRIRPSGDGLERITSHNGRVSFPVALDRHTLLYLATDADGAGPWMYALDLDRKVSHRISSGLESYSSLAASADGRRLVATIARRRYSVWRIALGDDVPTGAAVADNPTLVLASGSTPRLAADSLLYVSSRGERQGIWLQPQSPVTGVGAAPREIWSSAHSHIAADPSLPQISAASPSPSRRPERCGCM